MRLSVGRLLLPLLLLLRCSGLAEENRELESVYQKGVEGEAVHQNGVEGEAVHQNGVEGEAVHQNGVEGEAVHQNGIKEKTNKSWSSNLDTNIEEGAVAPKSTTTEFPCPSSVAIAPCVCSVQFDDHIDLNCTDVESEDQLAAVFQQEFPVKDLYQFTMTNNSAVKVLHNVMNGVTFERLYLAPGPFVLEMITDFFLFDLKETLAVIRVEESNLTTEMFPFLLLSSINQLEYLSISGSDIDWIPPVCVPKLSFFGISNSFVEFLLNGTVCVGAAPMTIFLRNNQIRSIEPGSIYFVDNASGASNAALDIILDLNELQSLQAGTFLLRNGTVNVNLRYNKIAAIEPGTFVIPEDTGTDKSGELTMTLSHNKLQSLQPGTFPLWNGRVSIYLDHNQIASIEPGTFVLPKGTKSMTLDLDLSYNELTTVDEEVFMDLIVFTSQLDLHENPLVCGCDIAWLVINATFMEKVDDDAACDDGTNLHDLDPQNYAEFC